MSGKAKVHVLIERPSWQLGAAFRLQAHARGALRLVRSQSRRTSEETHDGHRTLAGRCKGKVPNARHLEVGWLRTAYLLVFSLLGPGGYVFARSAALRPVREQIQNPDEEIATALLRGHPSESSVRAQVLKPWSSSGLLESPPDDAVLVPGG